MSDREVVELLRHAAGDDPGEPPVGALMRRGRRRRLYRRMGAVATAAVVVLAGTVAVTGLDPFRVELSPADTGDLDEPWPLRIRYELTSYDRDGKPFPPQPREFYVANPNEWVAVHPTPDGGARVQRSDGAAYASTRLPAAETPDADEPFALLAAARHAALPSDDSARGQAGDGPPEPARKPDPLFGAPFGDSLADTEGFEVIADDLPELRESVASRHGLDPDALVAEHVERPLASCPGEPGTAPQPREDTGGREDTGHREDTGGAEGLGLVELLSAPPEQACFERHRFVALPAIGLPLWVEKTHSRLGPDVRLEVTHLQLHVGDTAQETVLARPDPGAASAEWLADGTPVFVVAHEDDTISVVEAVSTHRVGGPHKLVEWCGSSRTFDDVYHWSVWNAHGEYLDGPAPTALATYATEATDDHIRVTARQTPKPRQARSYTERAGPPCAWPDESEASERFDPDRRRESHDPAETPWPTLTPAELTAHHTPAVVEGTAVYPSEATPRLCSEPAPGSPPRCPSDSPELVDTRPPPPVSAHTGTFLAVADDDGRYSLIGFRPLDSKFFVPPASGSSDQPRDSGVLRQRPQVRIEDGLLEVAALDIAYGHPPDDAIPAGSYDLRLDNRGNLVHTLVNDDLGVDLAAEPDQQATTSVELPPGEHVFYCRIGNHRQAGMELHLTVK